MRDSQIDNILLDFHEFYEVVAAHRNLDDIMQEYFVRDDIDTKKHFHKALGAVKKGYRLAYPLTQGFLFLGRKKCQLEHAKETGEMTDRNYYRCKNLLKGLEGNKKYFEPNDCILELDQKIKQAAKYYRDYNGENGCLKKIHNSK